MEERLQKLMAQAGLGSRRACEALISAGRVTVNGRVAVLGEKANPESDRILVDGRPLKLDEPALYIALYKPRGVLSAVSAPDTRPTVRELVDLPGRLYPVGRLDVDSEGLILLTNDGELANRLTHPRYGHEKEYRVLVASRPDEEQLQTWRRGVVLEDGYRTQPAEVRMEETFGRGAWLRIILREGRKRQIRETGSQLGLPVVKIIRVRMGSLYLMGMKPGEWRRLTDEEVRELKKPASPPRKLRSSQPQRSARPAASAEPVSDERRSPAPRRSPGGERPVSRPASSRSGRPGGDRSRAPRQPLPNNDALERYERPARPRRSSSRPDEPGEAPSAHRPASSRGTSNRPDGSRSSGGRSSGRPPAAGRPPRRGKPSSTSRTPGPKPPSRKKPPAK